MASLQVDFYSETLQVGAQLNVIIPRPRTHEGPRPTTYPCLYLLHGMSDDHTAWSRYTSIERYAKAAGLAVIMPAVGRTYYVNQTDGYRYLDYIAQELPEVCGDFFPISRKREETFIAGLSMGGYGAFRVALAHPGNYAAAASLSGALDIAAIARERTDENPQRVREFLRSFGSLEEIEAGDNDLLRLAAKVAESGTPCPQLFQCCGKDDFLYEHNRRFLAHARKLGLPLTYEEGPGAHDWDYWDLHIQRVLDWLPLS